MSSSSPIRVAIQGELGSFSHEAALVMLPGAEIVPCATAFGVFNAMMISENLNAAIIPIENSLAGSVLEFYDLFNRVSSKGNVIILREHTHRIRHNLIARPGTNLLDIAQVLSHPIALAQCRIFFEAHPTMSPVDFYDTAGSVKTIMQDGADPSQAAIASKQAAEMYRGEILLAGIEDNAENYTRFLLLEFDFGQHGSIRPSERIPIVGPPDKMSLIFSLKNQSGALVQALSIFSNLEMNLTKIESRPIQGRPWEYMFYVDVQFPSLEAADEALMQLRRGCADVIELGRYRGAVIPARQ